MSRSAERENGCTRAAALCLCTMALSCSLINKWSFSVDLIIPKDIDQASRGSRSSSRLLFNSVVTCTFAVCVLGKGVIQINR